MILAQKKLFWMVGIAIVGCVFVLSMVDTVHAIDLGGNMAKTAADKAGFDAANTTDTTFAETLGTVVQAVLSLVGIIFLSLMIYAGALWMTARGDTDQVEKSKRLITQSLVGLIIVVGAYSITAFVVPAVLERTVEQSGQQTPTPTP